MRPRRSFRPRFTLRGEEAIGTITPVVLVAAQVSVLGLYLPPVFK